MEERIDITVDAQIVMSAMSRTEQRFGIRHIIDKDPKINILFGLQGLTAETITTEAFLNSPHNRAACFYSLGKIERFERFKRFEPFYLKP